MTVAGRKHGKLPRAMKVLALLPLCFVGTSALQATLTDKDFKQKIEGKNALFFFQAPW